MIVRTPRSTHLSSSEASNVYKRHEKKSTSIFDRLHDCSREKHLEGKKRWEEMSRKQRLHDLYRSGAMKKASAERGLEV